VAGPQPQRPDAFVSYSRRDGEFVQRLVAALAANGKDLWVDLEDIPKSADWRARIEAGIESAKAVVVVVSPSFVSSHVCGEEMRHALRHNKRLVPVLRAEVDRDALLPELVALNWITAGDDASFDEVVAEVVEWERADRNGSFCLRGRDLGSAEAWLAAREGHREQPTDLQLAYIAASRRAARRRRFVVAAGRRRRRRVRARTVGALRRARRTTIMRDCPACVSPAHVRAAAQAALR